MSEESVDARPLQASSCWMLRSGVRSGQRKRSPLRPFWTRYRAWSAGGCWCALTHQKWML